MESSAPIVRPLYRSLLIAARNLAKQIERHGGVWSQILPQTEILWCAEQLSSIALAAERGPEDLKQVVREEFRRTMKDQDLDDRISTGFRFLSRLGRQARLLEQLTVLPRSEAVTDCVRVSMYSTFIAQQQMHRIQQHIYQYHVTITNEGKEPVTLLSRTFKILDSEGNLQEVHGPGVLGQQPNIPPGESHSYASTAAIQAKGMGQMSGFYSMVTDSGHLLDVEIAPFAFRPFQPVSASTFFSMLESGNSAVRRFDSIRIGAPSVDRK
ncbi:ApaG domain [Klebsormidium nitens]|uniref:ApaG domain n=1 Tax=Klebsormidium nitens TaxID=105231 RepID=A0A1Y1I4Q3_KLENI|nr:ApaG domain [Klebsormidium nitens]|eukprot:GAQ85920.1 ApaG domain [Klebsormidium nitens]